MALAPLRAHRAGYVTTVNVGGDIASAPFMPVRSCQRSTGRLNLPQRMTHFTQDQIAQMIATPDAETGTCVLMFAHTESGNGGFIGVFDNPAAARAWWTTPFNKLRRNAVAVVVEVTR